MVSDILREISRATSRAWLPPPRLVLSEWMERELRLPPDLSALPGPIRLYPYQRGIADAMSDPSIERVTVQKSARVGYTTTLIGLLGAHVVNDPAPVLFVLPTEDDCKKFATGNIDPTFSASPKLAGALDGDRSERQTLLSRRFPGGSLKIVAAKAPRNLRGHSARVVILDEVDAMEMTPEGHPAELAAMRSITFPNRKIIIGSTPVFADTSYVVQSYERSDKRVHEIPCPECGTFSEVRWDDIKWPESRPAEAYWRCPSCGGVVEERFKAALIAAGRWRATAPEVTGHAGFKVNALISLHAKAAWGILAQEFVAAQAAANDPSLLQTFTNLVLGEGWKPEGEELDDATLAQRAEAFGLDALPEDVLLITAGVDVQRDRLEVTLIGWTEGGTAFVLEHFVVYGDAGDDGTWRDLDDLLKLRWSHPLGGTIGIDAVAVDSGDGETQPQVYRFCWARAARKVFAVKGDDGFSRPFITRASKNRSRPGALWIVGVDAVKSHIAARLKDPGSIRFSHSLKSVWFEQLASERVVTRQVKGQPVRRFERIPGRRAEALDCLVYGFAIRHMMPAVNWAARAEALRSPGLVLPLAPPPRPRVVRSSWIDNN